MHRCVEWIWCPRADDGSQRALSDSVRLGLLKYVFSPYLKCIRMVWEKQEGTGQMSIGDVVKCILLRPQLTFPAPGSSAGQHQPGAGDGQSDFL